MSNLYEQWVVITLVTRGNNYTQKKAKKEYRVVLKRIVGKPEDLSVGDLAILFRDAYSVSDAKIAEGVALEKLRQFQESQRLPRFGTNEQVAQPKRVTLDYSSVTVGTLFRNFVDSDKPAHLKRSFRRAEKRRSYNGATKSA